ncbi:hypothetical protein PYCC9005_004022 [Savitreella phatthalungensis]
MTVLFALSLSLGLASAFGARDASSKRGLVGVNNVDSFRDQPTLINGTAMSWAYNYGSGPGNATWFGALEFVPQVWGGAGIESFAKDVSDNSPSATHIMTFNEPDGTGNGQSNISPAEAARLWLKYLEPMREQSGYTLVGPCTTGSDGGVKWTAQFLGNCTGCNVAYLCTHWYGEFTGLADHLGQLYYTFNATRKIWLTELADAHASYNNTLSNYNSMTSWLDGLDWVDRYAWFGGFRSNASNVGTNATFLDASGNLTTIGRSYLYSKASTASASATASVGTSLRSTTSASPVSRANAALPRTSPLGKWLASLMIAASVAAVIL